MSKINNLACSLIVMVMQLTGAIALGSPQAPNRVSLAPAKNDPFVGFSPTLKVVAAAKPSKTPHLRAPDPVPQAVATPQAPPLDLQYAGRLSMGDTTAQVYVIQQSQWFVLEKGTTLQNGYVVESVDAHGVRLRYPPLDVSRQFLLPPLPTVETR
jgi:hypothetical protein